jgi:hypothetical protein
MTAEERLRRLEDALTVEAELLTCHERLDEDHHPRIGAQLGNVSSLLITLTDRQLATQAALDRLIEEIERFLRDRPGNGHPDQNSG